MHILSDSTAKYVDRIKYALVHPFPGINVLRLTRRIETHPELVAVPFAILHVGTNDITSLSETELLSAFNNLITVINKISCTKIIIPSILPRLIDHHTYPEKVKKVNSSLKNLCLKRKIQFLHSFRPFFKFGKPIRELFAIRDRGLHLNSEGTRRLRLFFINTVAHLLK